MIAVAPPKIHFPSQRIAGVVQLDFFSSGGSPVPSLLNYVAVSDSDTTILKNSLKLRRDTLFQLGEGFDTSKIGTDTTGNKDTTTYTQYLDSTARTSQFVHRRYDSPSAPTFSNHKYSLYLDVNSPAYVRELVIDSSGRFVTVSEKVNGLNVKVPVTMTLEEYIQQRYEYEKLNNWRSFVYEYRAKESKDDLAGLLGSLTNIDIPVPPNPIFSIFGPNVIHLRITGAVDIRAGFRHSSTDQITISQLDQSRNEPNFSQDVAINVDGTIGDKLKIGADWNTQRTFEYENSLKIKYTGYDDEIIQSVEAGNVSLQTPGLIGSSQALFGIKTLMQLGPLKLTALLSQKKGTAKEVSISGGAQQNTREIFPFEYSKNHYFVDTVYWKFFDQLHTSAVRTITPEQELNRILENSIDVWVSTPLTLNSNVQGARKINAFIDLYSQPQDSSRYDDSLHQDITPIPGRSENGYFIKLLRDQYTYDAYSGYISLNQDVGDDKAIAVAYSTVSGRRYGETTVLGSSDTTVLVLKLVKPKNLQPSYKHAWELQLKNFYSLGGKDLKKEGFKLEMYYKPVESAESNTLQGENLLAVLGFDKYKADNSAGEDGSFDFIPGVTVDVPRAEIIFPTLRPFDSTIAQYFSNKHISIGDSLLFHEVYDTTRTGAQNNQKANLYFIKVTSSTAQSSRFPLGGFNIVEGSVQVLLNGTPLQPNVDYTVDYIIGEVVIRNPQALVPGANLQVKYEQNDLFQLASKTQMGARGEMSLSQNTRLGFTVMNLNQATLSDKVRLGDEPTNNTILGVDGASSFDVPFVTDALDALPGLHARDVSTLRFGGEIAYILPNSNTKQSTILGDKGESIAYIDDFEGARKTIPLTLSYTQWKLSSPPVDPTIDTGTPDSAKTYTKAKLMWYNNSPLIEPVRDVDIWPNKRSRPPGQDLVTTLILNYDPNHRGTYNFSPHLDSTLHRKNIGSSSGTHDDPSARKKNWSGIMRYISVTAGNLIDQNMDFIEIWMRPSIGVGEDVHQRRLYIDVGRVSEDVIPNESGKTQLNSEDIIKTTSNPAGIPNGVLNPGEDLGLDMLSDEQEKTEYSKFLQNNSSDPDFDPNDPSGDNYGYTSQGIDFTHINGTEKNELGLEGRFPDTEDLNGNGIVDLSNTYLEYEVPLDTAYHDSLGFEKKNEFIVGGGINRWYQFLIPLQQPTRLVQSRGSSETIASILQNVQYIRLWFSGAAEPETVRIADMNIVGNQWLPLVKNDSVMKISVVNIEDNSGPPDYYTIPPGVIRERDKTQPERELFGNEQSLSLAFNRLMPGDLRQAVKYFTVRSLDVFNYASMKLFVHGDPSFQYSGEEYYDADFFIRLGADTSNYYEYRQPLRPGVWDEINIVFSELTLAKAARDSAGGIARIPVPNGPHGSFYSVRGNPALTQIRYIGAGVQRRAPVRFSKYRQIPWNPISGKVWVNELRVIGVDNSPGYAYRFDTQLKLSDVGQVAFNYSFTNPNFHGIEQRFGNRITSAGWAMNSTFSFDKFLPQSWQGTSLSFGYSHQENLIKPKYLPSTDVVVEKAAENASQRRGPKAQDSVTTASQTLNVQDSYSLPSVHIALPWDAWYINNTLNKLSFNFSYTKSSFRDPSIIYRNNWAWNFGTTYGVSFPSDYYLQPFKSLFSGVLFLDEFKEWKLYFVPITSLSGGVSSQRTRSNELSRASRAVARESRSFNANNSAGFGWKLSEGGLLNLGGDYGLQFSRDLLSLDSDSLPSDFGTIVKNVFVRGRIGNYGQRLSVNTRPKLPNILDIPKYFDLSAGYSVAYGWRNAFQNGDIGKGAGWDNNITVNSNFRLKALTDPWFNWREETPLPLPRVHGEKSTDTTKAGKQDSTSDGSSGNAKNLLKGLKTLAKVFIKIPLLDYESINISFSQTNRSGNSGVVGGTGISNFFGRLPFQNSLAENGPSFLYQLGMTTDPTGPGTFGYNPSKGRGVRAANASNVDQFSQSNNITLKTNRPLWEGATLDLNWKVGWQYNKNSTFFTDNLGVDTSHMAPVTSGSVERSFITIPPIFFLKVFKSSLEDVGKRYEQLKTSQSNDAAFAQAFEEGLESFPILNRILGQFMPRANWSVRWSGLERIAGINSVVQQMSLEHNYTSTFRRDFRSLPNGTQQTDVERVMYGFSPLVGVTTTFKELFKGNLSGTFRYNTTTSYDLNLTSQNVVETYSQELSLSLSYSHHGFQLPLFGVKLSNDVDLALTYSLTRNSRRMHERDFLTSNPDGTPLDGNTRTTMEPRLNYTLSARVNASVFYRYTKMEPDASGSIIPGTTTNEAGVDIHIAIQ